MEINDYVRTKFNEIGRVVELCGKNSCGNLYKLDIKEQLYSEGNIIKHSKNIIDLVEEDDYIRIITSAKFDYVYMSYGKLVIRNDVSIENYSNKFIAQVITHEQINVNAYDLEKER